MNNGNSEIRNKVKCLIRIMMLMVLTFIIPEKAFAIESEIGELHQVGKEAGVTADIIISNAEELKEISRNAQNGNHYEGKVIKLVNDITFDGTKNNFVPIEGFKGTFDGCGHSITGLNIENQFAAGLFASIYGGEIRNLIIKDSFFKGRDFAGAIAAWIVTSGEIVNCHVINSSVQAEFDAGGIVGEGTKTIIKSCFSDSEVKGGKNEGGIIGSMKSSGDSVENCCNTGMVSGGAIAGSIWNGSIRHCFTINDTENESRIATSIGAGATISNCYAGVEKDEEDTGDVQENSTGFEVYSKKYMQSTEFLYQMNDNYAMDPDCLAWEFRSESSYPVLVKLKYIENCNISLDTTNFIYDGNEHKPNVTVIDENVTLVKDKDYTVAYAGNVDAGTASVTVCGIGRYSGKRVMNFTIAKANSVIQYTEAYEKVDGMDPFSLDAKKVCGDGSLNYQTSGGALYVDKKGRVMIRNAGVARVTISLSESANYNGCSVVCVVTVRPKKMSHSVTVDENNLNVEWTKATEINGYELQYAGNAEFTESCETIRINDPSICSNVISGLEINKNYYVRIRSYKVSASVEGNGEEVASEWSTVTESKTTSDKAIYSMKLDSDKKTLRVGKKATVKVTIEGASKANKKFKVKTNNKNVIQVSVSGKKIKIKAKKVGKAVITVTSNGKNPDNKKISKKIKVDVKPKHNKVEYGDTIRVEHRVRYDGIQGQMHGTDWKNMGQKTIVVSRDSDVFDSTEVLNHTVISNNVNKAIGKKVGQSFEIRCIGGDGDSYNRYKILKIIEK